jgi:hypothetical protein
MTENTLRDFVDGKLRGDRLEEAPVDAYNRAYQVGAPPDAARDDTEDVELEEGAEPDEGEEVSDAESAAFYAAIESELGPEALARATDDEDYRQSLWEQYQGDADDDEVAASGFETADDMIAAVLSGEVETVDADGVVMSPAAYLHWCATCPESEWTAAARAAGHDPRIRPSVGAINRFGKQAQGALAAESWSELKAKRQREHRYLGS